VLLIRFASEMGFTLSEIKVFLNGLWDDAPVGPRWKKLAHRKIQEFLPWRKSWTTIAGPWVIQK
jgi:hypothetical protein